MHPGHLYAQTSNQNQLEEVLSGFEEEDASAADGSDLDDIIEGFDDEASATEPSQERAPSPIRLSGHLKVGMTYNVAHDAPEADETDWRGLSSLKSELALDLEVKWHDHWRLLAAGKYAYDWAYGVRGQDNFTEEVLDQYEQESELGEAYIQGRIHRRLDIKAGRQIVVWGRSDNLRITDVLNPLDFREPGLIDIEDLRLPVTMTRLDSYWGPWNLTAIAGHEIRFNKNPVLGHDFYPSNSALPEEEVPTDGGGNTEWALALNGIFSGSDLSFYWADIYSEDTYVALSSTNDMIRQHARVQMYGIAGSLVMGEWIIIGESAYWQGLKYYNVSGETFERVEGLIGVEYSGWNDASLSLDWAVRHIVDFDTSLTAYPDYLQEQSFETAMRFTQEYWNNTLKLSLLAVIYGPLGQDGALERVSLEYDWSDAISSTVGAAFYQSGDKYSLSNIEDNDRVFLRVKYSY